MDAQTERELVERYQGGDASALGPLLDAQEGLCARWANKYAKLLGLNTGMTEGRIGLIRAIGRFDPSKGFRLSTYAEHWIRKYVQVRAKKEQRAVSMLSLDRPQNKQEGNSWKERLPDPASLTRELPDIDFSVLSPREQEVVHLRYYDDLSLEETGLRLGGLSRERVRQIEEKALAKLRVVVRKTYAVPNT